MLLHEEDGSESDEDNVDAQAKLESVWKISREK